MTPERSKTCVTAFTKKLVTTFQLSKPEVVIFSLSKPNWRNISCFKIAKFGWLLLSQLILSQCWCPGLTPRNSNKNVPKLNNFPQCSVEEGGSSVWKWHQLPREQPWIRVWYWGWCECNTPPSSTFFTQRKKKQLKILWLQQLLINENNYLLLWPNKWLLQIIFIYLTLRLGNKSSVP